MCEFFAPDPLIPGTDFSIDYQKSGYDDREHFTPAAYMGVLDGNNGAIIFSSINHLIISGMLLGTAFLSNSNILLYSSKVITSTSFNNFEVCNSSYVGVLLFKIKAPTSFTSSTTTTNITIFNFTTF
jgi:hypothetical protein